MQRRLVLDALQRLPPDLAEQLAEDLRLGLRLPTRVAALHAMHFPPADARLDALNRFATPAQQRLIFEEAFLFQMGLLARRRSAAAERKPIDIRVDDRVRESARRVLPFKLTNGQKQTLKEIVDDMRSPHPMNRLLQGDVGAGKTIVALLAAVVEMENGLQVAFMAPTEILAEQHFLNVSRLLQASRFRVALLTGSTATAARREQLAEVEAGTIPLVVGTHALVQGDVNFKRLGLVVIDEQHRFGVMQRATLRSKGLHPDVLVMTATPIPRTLALTVYGDLAVSVIRDVPNASVMIVEHAERFGLSQLHQLRGRVGRDRHQSYCFLLYQSPLSDEARERLHTMTDTTDGFEIAERDLRLRGPGDFFGTRQAGVPTFRLIDLVRDHELLEIAQREAAQWMASTAPSRQAIEA